MQQNILLWDTERQAFSEIEADKIIKMFIKENTPGCLLFLAWLPQIKSVFLHKRKRLEIVFQDGKTYELTDMPHLYDKLFAVRHGLEL